MIHLQAVLELLSFAYATQVSEVCVCVWSPTGRKRAALLAPRANGTPILTNTAQSGVPKLQVISSLSQVSSLDRFPKLILSSVSVVSHFTHFFYFLNPL